MIINRRMLKSKKSSAKILDKEKDAQAEKIATQASSMLTKEKHQGKLQICVHKDGDQDHFIPWANRNVKLESGVFTIYNSDQELKDGKGLINVSTGDIEAVIKEPFDISFFRDNVLHVIAIKANETDSEYWLKAIDTSRQLINLVNTDQKKVMASSPTKLSREELESKTRRIASYTELSLEKEKEKEKERVEREQQEARDKEEELKLSKDPIAKIWKDFYNEMKELKDAVRQVKEALSTEDFADIFNNFGHVLNITHNVYETYRLAKKNPSYYKEFKDTCDELEAYAWFCSNKELGTQKIKAMSSLFKEKEKIDKFIKMYSKPIEVIIHFSEAIRKYVEEHPDDDLQDLDEASAILQDVHDYILQVTDIINDWVKNTDNIHLKSFLSPAKRSMLFVDTTTNYPIAIMTDFLIIFKVEEKEEGKPSHLLHMMMPLSLTEVEGTTKTTKASCPTLGLTCTITCTNNQSANILRRKILETKTKLLTDQVFKLGKIRDLPEKFPATNCSLVVDEKLLLGTDGGIYYFDLNDRENLRKIANTDGHKVRKIQQSSCLQVVVYSNNKGEGKNSLFTYPLMALNAFYSIQKHVFPASIDAAGDVQLYACFDTNDGSQYMVASSEKKLLKLSQTKERAFNLDNSMSIKSDTSFIRYNSRKVYFGGLENVYEYNYVDNKSEHIFRSNSSLLPKECLQFEKLSMDLVSQQFTIICYEDHGVVFQSDDKTKFSTLTWTAKANSFAFYGENLLVYTDHYIEVRSKESIWQVKQIMASQNQLVLNSSEHYILKEGNIMKVVLFDKKDQEDALRVAQETKKLSENTKKDTKEKRKSRMMKE